MAPAVGVPDRVLVLRQRRGGGVEHGVRELRVRRGRHGPADDHSVEAVHDGAEIDLAGGYPEFGDVGEPEAIRAIGVEIALCYVLGSFADLAFARAVLALAGALGDAFMIRQTTFSDTATSSDLRAACTLRYP